MVTLSAIMQSSAMMESSDSGKENAIDISKFLSTDGIKSLMVVSFSISPTSLEPCKVDFHTHTAANGTFFVRYYLQEQSTNRRTAGRGPPVGRFSAGRKGREVLVGQFTNIGKAQEPKSDTMNVFKYGDWEIQRPAPGKLPQDVETIEHQSDDDACAIFSTSRRHTAGAPRPLLDFRVRASEIKNEGLACLTSIEQHVKKMKANHPEIIVPTIDNIISCQQKCLTASHCKLSDEAEL
uniref:Putative lipocalin-3 1 n=1 Tax=Amblyomma cajennense TaxID=34607 RepID=A0A023FNT1_AMBCJ